MLKLITVLLFSFSMSTTAKNTFTQVSYLNAILNNQIKEELKNPPLPDRCLPSEDTSSCIKSVCSYMPSYKCDEVSELQEIAKVCKDNFNGQCVSYSCSKMAGYKCDDLPEISLIASSCQHVYGSACQNIFTSRLPTYLYDDTEEWVLINTSCRFATADAVKCAEFSCSKLPAYRCDEAQEVRDILNSCIGQ